MTKKQKMMLPTYEDFVSVEYEYLNGGMARKKVGQFLVLFCTDISWTPSNEASYWFEIKIDGEKIKESREFPASNFGREKCWNNLKKTLEKMLNN